MKVSRGEARPASRPPRPGRGARAMTVMSGPQLALGIWGMAGARATVRRFVRARRPSAVALLGPAIVLGWLAVRPWTRRWNATPDEVAAPLPGDDFVPDAGVHMTRAVTVDAPPEDVWPWVAQIGQDRGGFYSYTRLENLAGCEMRNADRVHDEWQGTRDRRTGAPPSPKRVADHRFDARSHLRVGRLVLQPRSARRPTDPADRPHPSPPRASEPRVCRLRRAAPLPDGAPDAAADEDADRARPDRTDEARSPRPPPAPEPAAVERSSSR